MANNFSLVKPSHLYASRQGLIEHAMGNDSKYVGQNSTGWSGDSGLEELYWVVG